MERHALELFGYCPRCGGAGFAPHGVKAKQCSNCGFVYYLNPSAATALFVTDAARRLLVVTRGREPAKGTLDLPGGFVDAGETGEQAAVRELAEETGLVVPPEQISYLFSLPNRYLYSGLEVPTLDLFFHLHIEGETPALRAMDDAAGLQWLPLSSAEPRAFGLQSIRRGVAIYAERHAALPEDG